MKRLTIADLFCGAGGTSEGAVRAGESLGYKVALTAINHWDVAIATHSANHPGARHLCTSLDRINPRELFREGELDILWASPECTHHSNARGGKPINDQSRATAWCVVRWSEALLPGTVMVENVPEFRHWGAIGRNGRPLLKKKGETFCAWIAALESLGYRVEWRILCAADYGDPTTRRRLFVQAVRGRRRIVWPEPTHARWPEAGLLGPLKPWVAAREIIDWSLHGQSIYERKRPLSPKTMRRIMAGLEKFGLKPFLTPGFAERENQSPRTHSVELPAPTIAANGHLHLAEPFIVETAHGNGNDINGDRRRSRSIHEPVPTVCGRRGNFALVEPSLLPQQGGGVLRAVSEPMPTVSTGGAIGLVEPFLIEYYGNGQANSIGEPVPTVTCKDRHALVRPVVTLKGKRYFLDVRFRMLQPHELSAAQGFPRGYKFTGNKTEQVKQIGNAVPCNLARSLVRAHLEAAA